MIKFVNAKINLGLKIIRKRPDGYHDLSTIFYPVGLYNGTVTNPQPFCDLLEITPVYNKDSGFKDDTEPKYEFDFTGRSIDCPLEKNLVYRAAMLFKEAYSNNGLPQNGFNIMLEKHLPDGAGLGGGSADASFTLMTLNELSGSPFSKKDLIEMAGMLGADCPFFIENRPMAAEGKGEIMTPIEIAQLQDKWAVIIKPDIYISTREAFSGIIPQEDNLDLTEIIKLPLNEWAEAGLTNDFEASIFPKFPLLKQIKEELLSEGARYASMSGSGSAIYGIFNNVDHATETAQKFVDKYENQRLYSTICRLT